MSRPDAFIADCSRPQPLPAKAGIGLKPKHYADLLSAAKKTEAPAWVEVHPQNYFAAGGPAHHWLGAVAAYLPISFHSVGLSLGSAKGLNSDELERLARLSERYQPAAISDHLSWSGNAHDRIPDLLPIPYTEEALRHFTTQITRAQDRLGRPILIENPARMLSYLDDAMTEPEFLHRLCAHSGCGLLLDINNLVVSAANTGFDVGAYLDAIDPRQVGEIHLAGHKTEEHPSGPLKIDDHGSAVSEEVWRHYTDFISRCGPCPTLIEWDNNVPDYGALVAEARKADQILSNAMSTNLTYDHAHDG